MTIIKINATSNTINTKTIEIRMPLLVDRIIITKEREWMHTYGVNYRGPLLRLESINWRRRAPGPERPSRHLPRARPRARPRYR